MHAAGCSAGVHWGVQSICNGNRHCLICACHACPFMQWESLKLTHAMSAIGSPSSSGVQV
jgi:hypothetical protein